ncbi:hypothetical protein J2Z47_001285 [Cohnella thailandensis]|nr:hypothetical protein [Cohnella thailandensis]
MQQLNLVKIYEHYITITLTSHAMPVTPPPPKTTARVVDFLLTPPTNRYYEKEGNKFEISLAIKLLRKKMKGMEHRKSELEHTQVLLARMLANKLALQEKMKDPT